MSTSIETKLRTAALTFAPLTALLGTSPFRWYNTQFTEGSGYPAIVVRRVSGVPLWAIVGRMQNSWMRLQFTIWEGEVPDDSDATLEALRKFLDQFSATNNAGQFANQILNDGIRGFYAETQPGVFQTILDAMIFNNDES